MADKVRIGQTRPMHFLYHLIERDIVCIRVYDGPILIEEVENFQLSDSPKASIREG